LAKKRIRRGCGRGWRAARRAVAIRRDAARAGRAVMRVTLAETAQDRA